MEKVRLDVLSLSPSPVRAEVFTLLLGEVGGPRQLPLLVGTLEAQAIALALEERQLERPITYDLFKEVLIQLDYAVQEVLITDLRNQVFFAQMTLSDRVTTLTVDARPSDAIAMALRFAAALYIYEPLLEETHLLMAPRQPAPATVSRPATSSAPQPLVTKHLQDYSVAALKQILQRVVAQEDYEQAALLRDEIDRRSTAKGY